jgi:hypothetical protein
MKKIVLGILYTIMITGVVEARQNIQVANTPQIGIDVSIDPSGVPVQLQRDRIEMNTVQNADLYKESQIKRTKRKMILSEIFDPDVLMQPVTRVIRAIDSIGVTPEYITTILFPHEMEIKDAKTSFDAPLLEFNKNLLRFRPNQESFHAGNMVISLSDGQRNYEMSIQISRYYQKDCTVKNDQYICWKMKRDWTKSKSSKAYPYAYNNLSIYYTYKNAKILDSMDIISLYEKLKGHPLNLKTNGDFDVITYDGISYRIIRDDTFGEIYYRAHKYRVKVGS